MRHESVRVYGWAFTGVCIVHKNTMVVCGRTEVCLRLVHNHFHPLANWLIGNQCKCAAIVAETRRIDVHLPIQVARSHRIFALVVSFSQFI